MFYFFLINFRAYSHHPSKKYSVPSKCRILEIKQTYHAEYSDVIIECNYLHLILWMLKMSMKTSDCFNDAESSRLMLAIKSFIIAPLGPAYCHDNLHTVRCVHSPQTDAIKEFRFRIGRNS